MVMNDARAKLMEEGTCILDPSVDIHELLYADDTLLVGVHGNSVQKYMEAIQVVGAGYGLILNYSKTE
eukprot:9747254-Karenia_brevis.AAC.1